MFVCYSYQPITSLTGEFLTRLVGGGGERRGLGGGVQVTLKKERESKRERKHLCPLSLHYLHLQCGLKMKLGETSTYKERWNAKVIKWRGGSGGRGCRGNERQIYVFALYSSTTAEKIITHVTPEAPPPLPPPPPAGQGGLWDRPTGAQALKGLGESRRRGPLLLFLQPRIARGLPTAAQPRTRVCRVTRRNTDVTAYRHTP